MKIRIGIDVDGVLRDFVGKVADLAEEETGIRPEPPTTYYYDTEKISFRRKIWTTGEWLVPVFEEAKVIDGAKEGFEKFLANDRINLYIVSAQTKGTEKYTDNWLKKHEFDIPNIIYTSKKLEAPCQVLIDDKISNVKDYDENGRLGILMDTTYNKEYKTNRRVNSLLEAYELIEEKYGL